MAALSATLLRYITNQVAASRPDAVLLQRFVVDRDDDAFAGLVRRHGPVVYRVCRRLLGPTAADDAFQATFLVLATRAASVRKAGSVGSWLVGVAGRVARQMRKAEHRRAAREFAGATETVERRDQGHSETAEQARILDEELTRLSDRLRGPVVACLLQGRTYEQAAAELGGSARTVRRRLNEAKWVLRARLEGRGVVPTVAVGLIAGISTADAAIPAGLGSRTTAAVSGFLASGATIPAAVIAKGVATTMTTSVRLVSALVATAAVGLTTLGVGLAQDGKQTVLVTPATVTKTDPPADPIPNGKSVGKVSGGVVEVNPSRVARPMAPAPEPLPLTEASSADEILQRALPGNKVLHASYKLHFRSQLMVIAASEFGINGEGRVKLIDCTLVRFEKSNRFQPALRPTVVCGECAVLQRKEPVRSLTDLTSANIVAIEFPGGVRVVLHN